MLVSGARAYECPSGDPDKLVAAGWSAERSPDGWTAVSVLLKNGYNKDIKSIDGLVSFTDSKGDELDSGMPLHHYYGIRTGQTATALTLATDLDALIGAAPSSYEVHVCAKVIRFEDGSQKEF